MVKQRDSHSLHLTEAIENRSVVIFVVFLAKLLRVKLTNLLFANCLNGAEQTVHDHWTARGCGQTA